jgi:CheY-like chemotaxis protein
VLDDEFLIALDIQQTLENAGAASVICTGNAADALAALQREPPFDLAVLDVKLSGAMPSSMAVAAKLAERDVPFIFLTGTHGDDEHARRFPGAPVVDKPYQVPLLMEALTRVLASR